MGSLYNKQQSPHDLDNPALCNGLQSVDRYIGNTRQLPKMNQKSVASDVLYNVIWTHKFTIFTRFVGDKVHICYYFCSFFKNKEWLTSS
jgi:hypothetical protein